MDKIYKELAWSPFNKVRGIEESAAFLGLSKMNGVNIQQISPSSSFETLKVWIFSEKYFEIHKTIKHYF